MKNKQLMNHVCPKKPRGGNGNSNTTTSSHGGFAQSSKASPP